MTTNELKKLKALVEKQKDSTSFMFDKLTADIESLALKNLELEKGVVDLQKPPF